MRRQQALAERVLRALNSVFTSHCSTRRPFSITARHAPAAPRRPCHGSPAAAQTAAGDDIRQQIENARLGHGIEVGGRFIGDDKGRALSRARAIIIRCSMPPLISKG
jgi:hypothetical protein